MRNEDIVKKIIEDWKTELDNFLVIMGFPIGGREEDAKKYDIEDFIPKKKLMLFALKCQEINEHVLQNLGIRDLKKENDEEIGTGEFIEEEAELEEQLEKPKKIRRKFNDLNKEEQEEVIDELAKFYNKGWMNFIGKLVEINGNWGYEVKKDEVLERTQKRALELVEKIE